MLANCTIVNENYNNIVDFKPGKSAKAAKLSNFDVFRRKTSLSMKNVQPKEEPISMPQVEEKKVVESTVASEPQVTNQVSQTEPQAPFENKPETNVVSLPTAEVYQSKLDRLGVTCYRDVSIKGKFIPRAAKRLRTAYLVPKSVKEVRMNAISDMPFPEKEAVVAPEMRKEEKEEVKSTFDLGSLQNMSSNLTHTAVKEPLQKPTLNVDDYFKNENMHSAPPVEKATITSEPDEITSLTKDVEIIKEATENIEEERIALLERAKELDAKKIIKIQELREEKEFLTEKYDNLAAEVALLRKSVEEKEASLGMGNVVKFERPTNETETSFEKRIA